MSARVIQAHKTPPNTRCAAVWWEGRRSVRCRKRAILYHAGYYVSHIGLIFVCQPHYEEWRGTHAYVPGGNGCSRCGAHHSHSIHRPVRDAHEIGVRT